MPPVDIKKLAVFATALKALHQPGNPLVLANSYDYLSTRAVGDLPESKALATASYGVARAAGTEDDLMDMSTNLEAARLCALAAWQVGKPLSVDFQDGYGSQLEEGVKALVGFGVAGINLEDYSRQHKRFYSVDEATERIRLVLSTASALGVPDFVVNARCDVLVQGGELKAAIARGQRYLEAGATSVFVWGGSQRGVSRQEVRTMVDAFNGRLNVSIRLQGQDSVTVAEASKLGVSRCSIGPALQFSAMDVCQKEAKAYLT